MHGIRQRVRQHGPEVGRHLRRDAIEPQLDAVVEIELSLLAQVLDGPLELAGVALGAQLGSERRVDDRDQAVVVADQLTKSWIVNNVEPGGGFSVLGTWLNFVYGANSGILFGLVPQSAGAFAIVSMVVIVLIVLYHRHSGRGIVMTVATALLLGGAIGNLIDRLRFGEVVDWIDMGIGGLRFWTYNIADAAITTSLILIFAAALFPAIAGWGSDD